MLVGDSDNEERQKLVNRTRGILFYSTPHLGTPSAGLWSNAKYLLLPSVEVQELKQGTWWRHHGHGHMLTTSGGRALSYTYRKRHCFVLCVNTTMELHRNHY